MKIDKIKCKICDKSISSGNSYIGSHVKRKHNISLESYVTRYYSNKGEEVKEIECKFCKNSVYPELEINHSEYSFKKFPMNRYICTGHNLTKECKESISKEIFGESYDKKKFEHIGSNVKYLSLLYNIEEKEAKDLKRLTLKSVIKKNPFVEGADQILIDKLYSMSSKPSTCRIEDYKKRYGDTEGEKKYMERCYKISISNNLNWYTEKFGELEGQLKWEGRIKKYEKSRGASVSSSQIDFYNNVLSRLGLEVECEFRWARNGRTNFIDFYIPEKNLVIEYYGDYWHCNPKKYHSEYYHKVLKMTALEIWKKDSRRIDEIFDFFKGKVNVIVVWEGSNIGLENFSNLINNLNTIKTKLEL